MGDLAARDSLAKWAGRATLGARCRRLRSLGVLLGGAALAAAGCGGGPVRTSHTPGPMPPGESFTGVWFSPQYGEMHLSQTGTAVVGEYRKNQRSGRIQGRVSGNMLRFSWTENRELVSGIPQTREGRGYFRLVIGDDGRTNALGEWGVDRNEVGGGIWNAYRLRNRDPEVGRRREPDEPAVPFDEPAESESAGSDL